MNICLMHHQLVIQIIEVCIDFQGVALRGVGMMNNRPTDIAPTLKCHQVLLSLKIFIVENVHYKQSNNTVTQSNRIRTKGGSLYSSSPEHE